MSCLFRADEIAFETPKASGNTDCSTVVRGREAGQGLRRTAVS
jgi:hypothetical protein